jgi:cell division protein FtsI (penicillin-binding protein 3)
MRAAARASLKLEGSIERSLKKAKVRLAVFCAAVLVTFLGLSLKLFQLTCFFDNEKIIRRNEISLQQDNVEKEILRKSIYDRNGILISSNLTTSSLYANPKLMLDPANAAKQLKKILPELDQKKLETEFKNKKKTFYWVKRNLTPEQKYEVNALGIPALMFEDEEKRIYPHGKLFAHAIGMVGQDGHGLSGLEKYLDKLSEDDFDQVLSKNNITTTLDIRIQNVLREEMMITKEKHSAQTASGLVMDITNGEILALVSLPDYDPNQPKSLEQKTLFNTTTLGSYELGSVFKPITFAIAFNEGKINDKMVYDASHPLKFGRFKINDFHAKNRPLSVPEVLMYSSNIGTAQVAEAVGADKMEDYFEQLGFYKKLEFEINEKSFPNTPRNWKELTLATLSYGHGLAVSPLHLATAMASVVNGGLYYHPTIIKRAEGEKVTQPYRIFSEKTSIKMRDLMRLVVIGGSGGKANVAGYLVGGKTGTADKIDERGRYMENRVVSTFIGAFPMNNPKYLVMISYDDPRPIKETFGYATAGWTAAPTAGNVIRRMAPILKIAPQEDDEEALLAKYNVKKED